MCCQVPGRSVNFRSTMRAPWRSARASTSLGSTARSPTSARTPSGSRSSHSPDPRSPSRPPPVAGDRILARAASDIHRPRVQTRRRSDGRGGECALRIEVEGATQALWDVFGTNGSCRSRTTSVKVFDTVALCHSRTKVRRRRRGPSIASGCLRAAPSADRRAARATRRAAVPVEARRHLARDLARGGASLDRDRGQHPRLEAGRGPPRRGPAVGNKELSEYLEVRGYATAADWVYGQGIQPGDVDRRRPHHADRGPPHPRPGDDARLGRRAASAGTDREGPGFVPRARHRAIPRRDAAAGMDPRPGPHARLDHAMPQALRDAEERTIPEALADLHVRFEQIHPFLDGNGRAGRLVLNLLLVRLGIPPAIIYKGDRSRYLDALRRADQGDLGPLGEFLARAILDNLYRFVVPAVAGPGPARPAAGARDRGTLGERVARGGDPRTPQGRQGRRRDWRSSKAWVDEYRASSTT